MGNGGGTDRNLGIADLPFVAAESLAGAPPSEAYQNACDKVNQAAGNQRAIPIVTKSRIDLRSEKYQPYNAAGDSTHWRHNCRAYLDVGYSTTTSSRANCAIEVSTSLLVLSMNVWEVGQQKVDRTATSSFGSVPISRAE